MVIPHLVQPLKGGQTVQRGKARQLRELTGTGYRNINLGLDWLIQNIKEQKLSDCVACVAIRPHLFTEPGPVYSNDTRGFGCVLKITRSAIPPIDNKTTLGPFTQRNANYTCFDFTVSSKGSQTYDVGEIPADWCTVVYPAQGNASRGKHDINWPVGKSGFVLLIVINNIH